MGTTRDVTAEREKRLSIAPRFAVPIHLAAALELRTRFRSDTLVVLSDDPPPWLVDEACGRARAGGGSALYALVLGRGGEANVGLPAVRALAQAARRRVAVVPIAAPSSDVAEAVASAAEALDVTTVIVEGDARRGRWARFRRRHVLRRTRRLLDPRRRLLVYR